MRFDALTALERRSRCNAPVVGHPEIIHAAASASHSSVKSRGCRQARRSTVFAGRSTKGLNLKYYGQIRIEISIVTRARPVRNAAARL
jgi:hypothetical protein